jgi:hypothetical protein
MKKFFLFLAILMVLASCQKDTIEKPDNLIEREKMVDIIYDLSILQAMRNGNQAVLDSNKINPSTYIYKKYKVDSLQFARSNQYYAAENIKNYEKMYVAVNDRLLANKAKADTLAKKEGERLKLESEKAAKKVEGKKLKKTDLISN